MTDKDSTKNVSKKSAIGKATALLAMFAFVSVLLIVITDYSTKETIAKNQEKQLLSQLNEVLPNQTISNSILSSKRIVTDFPALNQQATLFLHKTDILNFAVFDVITPRGYSGNINILVGINLNTQKISGVRVLKHKETPGLGDKLELRKSPWVLSFDNKQLTTSNSSSWQVKKDGGDFDQFTGATITPRAVVNIVKDTLDFTNKKLANDASFFDSKH